MRFSARLYLALLAVYAVVFVAPAKAADSCADLISLGFPDHSDRKPTPPLPKTDKQKRSYEAFLKDHLDINPTEVTWGKKFPVVIHGGDENSFDPPADFKNAIRVETQYDTVIVGGGTAGLSAAFRIAYEAKSSKVLVLDKEPQMGGVAAVLTRGDLRVSRGGAYFARVSKNLYDIFKRFGLWDFKPDEIQSPTDSYYWNGVYYKGMWENPDTMAKLPASFSVFKLVLKHSDASGLIVNQPIELNPDAATLDSKTAAQWIREMPTALKDLSHHSTEARQILERYEQETSNNPNGMDDVIHFLDLYCRSALGESAEVVNAQAFANFYISEIVPRYTTASGTMTVDEYILRGLRKRPEQVSLTASSPVVKVVDKGGSVDIYYVQGGKTFVVNSKTAIFSAQLKMAPKLIENFESLAPLQNEFISSLEYRDYLVINVHVEGHDGPNSYDTWERNDKTYSQMDYTDVIRGRFVETHGYRVKPTDDRGVWTIYFPLSKEVSLEPLTKERVVALTELATQKFQNDFNKLLKRDGASPLKIRALETSRWPYSIHVTKPHHFANARVLNTPVTPRIFLANNNQGTPAVEEASFRGDEAAKHVLKLLGVNVGDSRR